MITILVCIILIGIIVAFAHALDFRDHNLQAPCPGCGGEMIYAHSRPLDQNAVAKYQCKSCGCCEQRGGCVGMY